MITHMCDLQTSKLLIIGAVIGAVITAGIIYWLETRDGND